MVTIGQYAAELGVLVAIRRGGVLTLAPEARICARGIAREDELVRGVAYALLQFTPSVVPAAEAVVLLDVTATLHLFHGIRAIRRRVREPVASVGLTGAVSLASTGPAAWTLARGSLRLSPP